MPAPPSAGPVARRRPSPPARHERRTLALAARGPARLVVVADTHGRPHPAAATQLGALAPDAILHAGDIGDLAVLDGLRALAPVWAVRGNIDDRASSLPDSLTLAVTQEGRPLLTLLLTHIAVAGPHLRADAARLAAAEGASLVVCGHSHVPFLGRDRGLVVFNPGSIGPRRFHLPIVFGVIDFGHDAISMHHVDVETGARWAPP
jgi:uncharacterized protein